MNLHEGNKKRIAIGTLMTVILGLSMVVWGCCGRSQGTLPTAQPDAPSGFSSVSRTITDMAGRNLTVPGQINKVFCTSPIGTVLIYALAPEKLAGWNTMLNSETKKYILPEYHNLPVLGGWFGKNNTGNIEEIMKVHPDIILSVDTIDPMTISTADKIQKQLGIPVVVVDGTLTKMDKVMEFLGSLLGEETRAQELASYCRKTFSEVVAKVDTIPTGQRTRVYYAEGPEGLQTDPKGSLHTEVLELAGGINVAECSLRQGYGRTDVSMEQVISWDPDVIIVGDPEFYSRVFNDSRWKNLKAVRARKVYLIPQYPFNWFDRPPSVNRLIGIWWVADLLYHDKVSIDIATKAKEFYALFYHYHLTDQELNIMLHSNKTKSGQSASK